MVIDIKIRKSRFLLITTVHGHLTVRYLLWRAAVFALIHGLNTVQELQPKWRFLQMSIKHLCLKWPKQRGKPGAFHSVGTLKEELAHHYYFFCSICCHCYFKAKQRYEREEKRKELKRQRGEDTWMLPEIDQRLQEIEEVRQKQKTTDKE